MSQPAQAFERAGALWDAAMEYANIEDGYGYLIETSHASPGVAGSALPWAGGEEHKELMSRGAETASFVCTVASTRWPVSEAWIAICAVS